MLAVFPADRRGRTRRRHRLAFTLRFDFRGADPGLQLQQFQLCIAELLARRPVFFDQLEPQAFFQSTDLPLGPFAAAFSVARSVRLRNAAEWKAAGSRSANF